LIVKLTQAALFAAHSASQLEPPPFGGVTEKHINPPATALPADDLSAAKVGEVRSATDNKGIRKYGDMH